MMRPLHPLSLFQIFLPIFFSLSLVTFLLPLFASIQPEEIFLEDSYLFKELASSHVRDGHYEKAIELLEPYIKELPSDDLALQLIGISYLQTERPEKARDAFQQALSFTPPEESAGVEFYLGWSHLALGSFKEGYFWLSQSHAKKEYWEKASRERRTELLKGLMTEAVIDQDVSRTRTLASELLEISPAESLFTEYQFGLLSAYRGGLREAREHWQRVINLNEESILAENSRYFLEHEPFPRWKFSLPLAAETFWNSNVALNRQKRFPKVSAGDPQFDANRESWGWSTSVRPTLTRTFLNERASLAGSYFLEGRWHGASEARSFDDIGQIFRIASSASLTREFPLLAPILGYSYGLFLVNREGLAPLLNFHGIDMTFNWTPNPILSTQLIGDIRWLNFYDEGYKYIQSRDGAEYSVGAREIFRLFSTPLTLHTGYFFRHHETVGSDLSNGSHELSSGFRSPLYFHFQLLSSISLIWRRFYSHPTRRSDFQQGYTSELAYTGWHPLQLFVRGSIVRNDSTTSAFDYGRMVYSTGLIYWF